MNLKKLFFFYTIFISLSLYSSGHSFEGIAHEETKNDKRSMFEFNLFGGSKDYPSHSPIFLPRYAVEELMSTGRWIKTSVLVNVCLGSVYFLLPKSVKPVGFLGILVFNSCWFFVAKKFQQDAGKWLQELKTKELSTQKNERENSRES